VASFADGSASAPAITNTGDTNTGIFFPAADTIAFSEGGTEAMRLDASGNLGLGVTPSAWKSTFKAIQLGAASSIYNNSAGDTFIGANFYTDTSDVNRYLTTTLAAAYGQLDGTHAFFTAPSGTAGDAITFTQAMTLNASGNLGIRATSMNAQLSLKSPSASGDQSMFEIQAAGSTSKLLKMTINQGADVYTFGTDIAGSLAFQTNATERMRIDSSGNLLVGRTAPDSGEKFNVTGNSAETYLARFYHQGDNSNRYGLIIRCGTNNASGTNFAMAFDDGDGTRQGQITFSGGTTTYGTSSDYRLKENIVPINNVLERLALLKPCKWNWKRDGGESEGFVAHELQKVVPIAVAGEKDAVDAEGNPVYQSVGAANIVPLLTAAIQEQQAIINDLKSRIETLESK
jgi:hypothetical protein